MSGRGPAAERHAFAEEVEVLEWIHDEVRSGAALPVAAAETVVQALWAAMRGSSGTVLPQLQLPGFERYPTTHSVNVCVLAMAMAEQLGLAPPHVRRLGLAGLLHDIGMVFVPAEILTRPGILTEDEMARVTRHPVDGARLLLESEIHMDLAAVAAYEHHITFRGGGYPQAVMVPSHFVGRLIQICDVYDALLTDRPSRPAWPAENVTAHLVEGAGVDFDPDLVHTFLAMLRSVERVAVSQEG